MAYIAPHGLDGPALMSAHVAGIEACLSELDAAFASGDPQWVERQCQQLQSSLADSVVVFRRAVQAGQHPLSDDLKLRLTWAQARVLAQQGAVHRAHACVDRTLGALLPREGSATYGNLGLSPAAKAVNAYR